MKYVKMLILCVVFISLYAPITARAAIQVNGFPDLPDGVRVFDTIVIAENKSGNASVQGIYLYVSTASGIVISKTDATIYGVNLSTSGDAYYTISGDSWKLEDGEWKSIGKRSGISGTSNGTYFEPTVYYSNKPIYALLTAPPYTDMLSSNEVVFQSTSQGRVPTAPGQELGQNLVGIVTTETTKPLRQEIIGIAGLLIPFLILLLGFYKGWRFLSTLLRRA